MKAARGFYVATQTINVIVAMVGVAGIIVTIINFLEFLESVPIPGLLPGASGPGNFFAVMGGLGMALLAVVAFLTLRRGHRWACWLSIPMWLVIWVMAYVLQFFFTQLIPGFKGKYGMPVVFVVAGICLVGVGIAAWTFFLMPALERKQLGERNVVPSREP